MRQPDGDRGAGIRIGIAVKSDVHPPIARLLHQPQIVQMAAHARSALPVMRKMHRAIAQPPDFQRLLPRRQQPLRPQTGAGVRMVVAAQPRRHPRQRPQLGGGRISAGRVIQPGRQPPSPLLHRLAGHGFHILQLGGGGRAVAPAHAPNADGRVAQNVSHIDRHRVVILIQQLRDGKPVRRQWRIPVQPRIQPDITLQFLAALERRVRNAVNPHQFGSNALPHLGVVMRLPQNGKPGMGMQINKPRTNHPPRGVNHPRRLQPGNIAAPDTNPVPLHQRRPIKPRTARPIHNQPVGNNQVQHNKLPGRQLPQCGENAGVL